MSILGAGLLGNSRNGIGNIITYVVKGRTIARTKPATYNDAKTVTQTAQRSKLTVLMALARLLLGVIRTSFQTKKTYQSGINAFISQNLKPECFVGSTLAIRYENLVLAKGLLQPLSILGVAYLANSGQFTVSVASNANGVTGFDSDLISVVIIHNATGKVFTANTGMSRSSGMAIVTATQFISIANPDFSVYVYARSNPATKMNNISDSSYELAEF